METSMAMSHGSANAPPMETATALSRGAANAPPMETSTGLPMVRPMRLSWKHPRASPWCGQCASLWKQRQPCPIVTALLRPMETAPVPSLAGYKFGPFSFSYFLP